MTPMRWSALIALALIVGTALLPIGSLRASAQTVSPEQELADSYKPIVFIKEQPEECSSVGEAYLPVPVDVVFGDPNVKLKQHTSGVSPDPVIMTAPTAKDLAGKDSSYYLDFPGKSRNPGCDYEKWSRQRMAELGLQPSVYARIAREDDRPGKLVLQYWFYWVFNDFNNTHESDWEMVQLMFNADTVEQALERGPSEVVYAQHGGGEEGGWNDVKVQAKDTNPIVFPAAGSHASYYSDQIWIGWGENGSGFGCDVSDPPSDQLDLNVILLPENPDPNGQFGWLLFNGRWGERQPWEFNGPLGPNAGRKWKTPVSWTDGLRRESLSLPHGSSLGPGPERFFCSVSSIGGKVMTRFPSVDPKLIAGLVIAVVAAIVLLSLRVWRYLIGGIRLYGQHIGIFLGLSILMIPVAYVAAKLQDWIVNSGVGGRVFADFFGSSGVDSIIGLGFGNFQQFLLAVLVAPGVIHATYDLTRKDPVGVRESWARAINRFPTLAGALLLNIVLLILMSLTIVLIPLALIRGVQWLYTPHAVMIDGATWRQARHISRDKVKGRWFRTLSMSLLIWVASGVPGPLIASLALIAGLATQKGSELIAVALFAFFFPVTYIASTIYYLRIGDPASWSRIGKGLSIKWPWKRNQPEVAPAPS